MLTRTLLTSVVVVSLFSDCTPVTKLALGQTVEQHLTDAAGPLNEHIIDVQMKEAGIIAQQHQINDQLRMLEGLLRAKGDASDGQK